MEKIIREFDSHQEAYDADWDYYAGLSKTEHLEHFLKLMEPIYAAAPGFQRIYRVADLSDVKALKKLPSDRNPRNS